MKFKSSYGTEYEIKFVKTRYMYDDSLAVEVLDLDDEFGWWEPYGMLTVNIGGFSFGPNAAYLDTNNMRDMCEFVVEKGWATEIGVGRSGFCTYPLVEFTSEFLEEICEEAA